MLGLASEGDVFTHGAHPAGGAQIEWGAMGFCTNLTEIGAWANGARVPMPNITQRDAETGWQFRALALPGTLTIAPKAAEPVRLNAVLARGVSRDQSSAIWTDSLETIARVEAGHRED